MRPFGKYSKATICRHMKKSIGDLAVDRSKENQGRPPKLQFDKRETLYTRPKPCKKKLEIFV